VAVKVDRELRPDVDAVYQDYVAGSTGSAGWPLTVWLTPDRLPVYGGTYFPAVANPGMIAFKDAVEGLANAWRADRADVEATAARSLEFLRGRSGPRPHESLSRNDVDQAIEFLVQIQDLTAGGLRGTMKFPQLPGVEFLAAYARLVPDGEILRAIEKTMLGIVRGGIFDQAGGGVHRYATDPAWRVPHFEKMLYDQGLLLSALATAAGLASSDAVRDEYAHAALVTAAFLRREMACASGGFAAALSADTGGVEGATYTWTRAQLVAALDHHEVELAERELGAPAEGDDAAVTLHRPGGRAGDAAAVDAVLAKLAAARAARPQPDRDTKRLTGWNAITARGLLDAGRAFGDAAMTADGVAAVRWLEGAVVRPDGVVREPDDASVATTRILEDAAHLVSALLTAAELGDDAAMLARAAALHADCIARFSEGAALYMTPAANDLPVRPREGGDSALPSGSSTVIENAVRLGAATGDPTHFDFAREALGQWRAVAESAPEQAGRALAAAVALEEAGEL
jgi:uncharacterized protein YyaL (SSP411 family)